MITVSVILPVYNAERFLREAIDSILHQTFTDFELIINNDGSTDASEEIILSYNDDRIVYVNNNENRGLVFSLNTMLEVAAGKYIARMDADDVALPNRLAEQIVNIANRGCAVLATTVSLIDGNGNVLPDWKDDKDNLTAKQIRSFLRKDNCIGHPTIVADRLLMQRYKYLSNQKYSEDYDLWLRLTADGYRIEKLSQPLLHYRILATSVTRFKKVNIFLRLAKVKFRFCAFQLRNGRFSAYVTSVFFFACWDLVLAAAKEVKALFKK